VGNFGIDFYIDYIKIVLTPNKTARKLQGVCKVFSVHIFLSCTID
jgi:hypothetical protein